MIIQSIPIVLGPDQVTLKLKHLPDLVYFTSLLDLLPTISISPQLSPSSDQNQLIKWHSEAIPTHHVTVTITMTKQ